jgi:ribonuclease BN (tRNA processing enzyme)
MLARIPGADRDSRLGTINWSHGTGNGRIREMKLTVLGSCGGYPRPGRACSGYLLENQGESLVVDMGTGTMSNMLRHVSFEDVGGVALTHLHPDHFVDLYALYTARRFSLAAGRRLPVLAPGGTRDAIEVTLTGKTRTEFFEYLDFIEADGREPEEIAGFTISSSPANHSVPSLCLRISGGGRTICYTGDTDKTDAIAELARGADLFICEATFTSELPAKIPGHLFASEAGVIAREAGVGRLLLTHVWPTLDEARARLDAAAEYDGPIEVAHENLAIEI